MKELDWEVVLLSAAGLPATLFVFAYGFAAPWWRSVIGRALWVSDLSLALLLDLALVAYWLHFELPAWARLSIYALVAVGAWLRLGAVANNQILKRRDRA